MIGAGFALGVNGDDDALVAEFFARAQHQVGVEQRGGVEADLVGPGVEHQADVVEAAQAAADGQRHEAFARGALDHVAHDGALVARGGDVEEDQFVRALVLIFFRRFDGVARINQIHKIDAFDDAPGVDVQARNDANGKHESIPVLTLPDPPAPPRARARRGSRI